MRAYKLIIEPGTSQEIAATGNYVRLKAAGVSVFIESPDKGEAAIMDMGDSLRLGDFVRIRVSHESAVAQEITLYIGKDTRLDSSRVAGVVEVINGELSRVYAGQAFAGHSSSAAGAGLFSRVQLWNPPASGVDVVFSKSTQFVSVGPAKVSLRWTEAPLTNLYPTQGSSKMLGGAGPAAQLREDALAAHPASDVPFINFSIDAANKGFEIPFSEPLVVSPGFGVILTLADAVNVGITTTFQWLEVKR